MIEEDTVLKVLALGLDNSTPDQRIEYLLKKLYGKDGLILDSDNAEFYERIIAVAKEIRF